MQIPSFLSRNPIGLAVFSAVSIGFLSSCQTEGCTDPMSDNYDADADKDDGSCIPWRDKFIGNYSGKNACTGSADQDVSIVINESGTTEDGMVITVTGAGLIFTAKVTAQEGITVPSQTITYQSAAADISGSGTISNDSELTINYNLVAGPVTTPCTLTATKL